MAESVSRGRCGRHFLWPFFGSVLFQSCAGERGTPRESKEGLKSSCSRYLEAYYVWQRSEMERGEDVFLSRRANKVYILIPNLRVEVRRHARRLQLRKSEALQCSTMFGRQGSTYELLTEHETSYFLHCSNSSDAHCNRSAVSMLSLSSVLHSILGHLPREKSTQRAGSF